MTTRYNRAVAGVFKKDGQYYIIEAKYSGTATLNTSNDGKQLSKNWVESSDRIINAVNSSAIRDDIFSKGYKRIWSKVAPDGSISFFEVDDDLATIFKIFTP